MNCISRHKIIAVLVIYGVCISQVALGVEYFMRADGESDGSDAAASCSSPATAMSVETHNRSTFRPGDIINLCDSGGEYKSSIIAPSSGSDKDPIIYKNAHGHTPVIDLSVDVGGEDGWTDMGNGVYRKKGYGRVFWEDDEPLKAASSEACSDGNWYYPIGSGKIYYRPTSGAPAGHSIRTMWFERGWSPYGIDLRSRSNITVHGITINRTGGGIGHGQDKSSPVTPIRNIVLHDNKFNKCMWAIWSQVFDDGVESDVRIYDNHIEYCNSGISAWTNSDSTPGHTQHHAKYTITGNEILNLNSLSDSMMWSDALLKSYYYTDHEGISFQDVKDSLIEGNTITTTFVKDMTSDHYWCRAIYLYLTNGDSPTTGNSILRNNISGHFYPSIYISTAKDHAGFENNTIAYNVIHYELEDKGHISFGVNAASDNHLVGVNYFVNNTVVNAVKGLGIHSVNRRNGNWVIRNNIIKSHSVILISDVNNEGGMKFDHNMYPGADWGFQVGTVGMRYITWRDKYKYDTDGSSVRDPLFVSPENNFHLRVRSPAIDAGVSVGLHSDNDGSTISGAPDIGAYEYKSDGGFSRGSTFNNTTPMGK